jgi:hypothetical protein
VKLRGELVGRDGNVERECRGFDTTMRGVVSLQKSHQTERAMGVRHRHQEQR